MEQPLIKITNLKKSFGKRLIFNNLNLNIQEGEALALMGPNGSGKTTLLDIICGLCKVTAGKIEFKNQKDFFLNLGMQFQDGKYPTGIRVKDLIWLYANLYNEKIDKKLKEQFQIKKIEKSSVNSISFGERKRLELFLLLNSKNKILILDEITSGMDISVRLWIIQCLKEYMKLHKVTLIYISHDFREVEKLCNRVVMLGKKGIIFDEKIESHFSLEKKIESVLTAEAKNEK